MVHLELLKAGKVLKAAVEAVIGLHGVMHVHKRQLAGQAAAFPASWGWAAMACQSALCCLLPLHLLSGNGCQSNPRATATL